MFPFDEDYKVDDCNVEEEELVCDCFQGLCEALKQNNPEETYVFISEDLTDEKAQTLGESLLENYTVTRMDIKLCHLTATGPYEKLLAACQDSSTLTCVKLSGTPFGAQAEASVTARFLAALAGNRVLQQVEIYNCEVPSLALANLFGRENDLKELQLSHCRFLGSPGDVGDAFAATSLETLHCVSVPEEYLTAILANLVPAPSTSSSSSLQLLKLAAHYRTTVATTRAIADLLGRCSNNGNNGSNSLQQLTLMSFRFRYDQMSPLLAPDLSSSSTTLRRLALEYCSFDVSTTLDLERFLTSPSCPLQSLALRGHLEFGYPVFLANVLSRNRSLSELDLDSLHYLTDDNTHYSSHVAMEAFWQSLHRSNTTLKRLNLGLVSRHHQCQQFCHHLPQITTLNELTVKFAASLKEQKINLLAAFRNNRSLTQIDCRFTDDTPWLGDNNNNNNSNLSLYCLRNQQLPVLVAQPNFTNALWLHVLVQTLPSHETQPAGNHTDLAFRAVQAMVGQGLLHSSSKSKSRKKCK